jgi:hypothetical protein
MSRPLQYYEMYIDTLDDCLECPLEDCVDIPPEQGGLALYTDRCPIDGHGAAWQKLAEKQARMKQYASSGLCLDDYAKAAGVQRSEVGRLVAAGILVTRRQGRSKIVIGLGEFE